MTSYLIAWKPQSENKDKGWPEEDLNALAQTLRLTGRALEPWRFHRKRGVQIGERVFLVRQGKRGHAVLGYGTVADPIDHPEGFTTVSFQALVDTRSREVLATAEELHEISRSRAIWGSMSSGIALPDDIAAALEKLVVGRTPVPDSPPSPISHDWQEEELEAAVAAYLEMRRLHFSGKLYSKASYYKELAERFNRTAKAFEYRMQNISHVLSLLGRDWIPGLAPARNVGKNVAAEIERLLFKVEGQSAPPSAAFETEVQELRVRPAKHPPTGVEIPTKATVSVTAFSRDAAVVAWVLSNAQGTCECCRAEAPFRRDDDLPFLEVHHLIRLADGGADTIANAVAVCPNCHRELHHGKRRKELVDRLRQSIPRLREATVR
jgi:5-methylcytosine-specific restriction protein A